MIKDVNPKKIHDYVAYYSKITPHKFAIQTSKTQISYDQLDTYIQLAAKNYINLGVRPGDRICIASDDAVLHLIAIISSMSIAAIPVPLPDADSIIIREIVSDADPKIILSNKSLAGCESITIDLNSIFDNNLLKSNFETISDYDSEDIAIIYYTSGTSSGKRKGVQQSYRMLQKTADYIIDFTRINNQIIEFVASSVDNAFWFGRCRCVLQVGGTLLLNNGVINPFSLIELFKKFNGNAISGDTPIYLLFMGHMLKNFKEISEQLKWIKIASQPMPLSAKHQLLSLAPNAHIVMGYGLTEAMRTCLLSFNTEISKLHTDGLPCKGVEIKICDDDGVNLENGQLGSILVKGVNLANGYWRNEDMWNHRFDGLWYDTGDLGSLDEDGYLKICGRKDETINCGGKTISLIEVQSRLATYIVDTPFVVVGINDPRGIQGEILTVCIEGTWKEPIKWKDLRVKLFEQMDVSYVPKFAYSIRLLPKTANQKVQLSKIRQSIENNELEQI